jgi:hypothetical protein
VQDGLIEVVSIDEFGEPHQSAINEALRAVRDLRAEVLPVLADLQVAIAAPRDRVAEILGAIVRRRKRTESA